MNQQEARKNIINRLRTIKGHIQGIENMVADGKNCEEILLQIGAVKASMEKVGLVIIEDHAKDCLIQEGLTQEEISRVLKTIIKFIK